jgi:hypothetical protein
MLRVVRMVRPPVNDTMTPPAATLTVASSASVEPRRAAVSARRTWWIDALIAVILGFVALLYRLNFPPDGLFFDDGWQAFGATRGSFSELLTVGQSQPGFGVALMVWSRVVGAGTASMVTPALIGGVLGPPALYLALRRFRIARSVSALLGAALVVCTAHVIYSGRVKAYTFEVLVVLLLAVTVPWLARRSWRTSTAIGWIVGSMILACVSSFALGATVAAAIVLVLHPRKDDLRLRLAAVAAQGVGVLGVVAAVDRTHSAQAVADFFRHDDAYMPTSLNPATFLRETFHHLTRITAVFPGGPAWFTVVTLAVVVIGLGVSAAGGGSRAIAARFMVVAVLLAFVGSFTQQVPFGPMTRASRLILWMTPILAFGIAVVLQTVRREIARRGEPWKLAFDGGAFVLAGLLLLTALGTTRSYPDGGAASASRQAMQLMQRNDALLVSPNAMYSFALDAGTPVRLQATPDRQEGFMPHFRDHRIHVVVGFSNANTAQLDRELSTAGRVLAVSSFLNLPASLQYQNALSNELRRVGFRQASTIDVNNARIIIWRRA